MTGEVLLTTISLVGPFDRLILLRRHSFFWFSCVVLEVVSSDINFEPGRLLHRVLEFIERNESCSTFQNYQESLLMSELHNHDDIESLNVYPLEDLKTENGCQLANQVKTLHNFLKM